MGTRPKEQTFSMFPVQASVLVPRRQSLAVFFTVEPASSFTCVVAGTEGCLTRRWVENLVDVLVKPGNFVYPVEEPLKVDGVGMDVGAAGGGVRALPCS